MIETSFKHSVDYIVLRSCRNAIMGELHYSHRGLDTAVQIGHDSLLANPSSSPLSKICRRTRPIPKSLDLPGWEKMNERCSECNLLNQQYSDAMRFETSMLAEKLTASENGQKILVSKIEPVVLEAARRRLEAQKELHRHQATHTASVRIMGAHGGSS